MRIDFFRFPFSNLESNSSPSSCKGTTKVYSEGYNFDGKNEWSLLQKGRSNQIITINTITKIAIRI